MEDSNEYEILLNTYFETSKLTRADTNPLSHDDSVKQVEETECDCLLIEDHCIADYFQFEQKFQKTYSKHINEYSLASIVDQLSGLSFFNYQHDSPPVGVVNNIEGMVESVYNYDKNKIDQISEEICYVKKLATHWRTIGGDGNCFYRSAIFGYLENIILERDIVKLKSLIIEIDEKFDDDYVNTKYLSKSVKEPIIKLNKRLVLNVLYLIYDILDVSNGKTEDTKRAYSILIKAMNNSKIFDIVKFYFLS
jgi:hypothetical protein